jgi:hypothetical protein
MAAEKRNLPTTQRAPAIGPAGQKWGMLVAGNSSADLDDGTIAM